MSVNHKIISETVLELLQHSTAKNIAEYINNAISMHRQVTSIKPTIEYNNQSIFVFYAEDQDTSIELLGYLYNEHQLRKEKKIHITTQKDSYIVQSLLVLLYTNIASSIIL